MKAAMKKRQFITPILTAMAITSFVQAIEERVRRLPCPRGTCTHALNHDIYIYSALREPSLREVSVFMDLNFHTYTREQLEGCAFTYDTPEGEKTFFTAGRVLETVDVGINTFNFVALVCGDPYPELQVMPGWIDLRIDGKDIGLRVPLEEVSLKKEATLGACVGSVYRHQFTETFEWLNWYHELGVSKFHIYFTNTSVQWSHNEISAAEEDASSEAEETSLDPVNPEKGIWNRPSPIHHPNAEWIVFDHIPWVERGQMAQPVIYSECLYRHRHAYEYLMFLDIDEFLVIRDERFQGKGSLVPFLRHTFPPSASTIAFFRYPYREGCEDPRGVVSDGEPYHARFSAHAKFPEEVYYANTKQLDKLGDKQIVKPLHVEVFWVHYVQSARGNSIQTRHHIQPSQAYIKHVRNFHAQLEDCSKLSFEEPVIEA